MKTIDIQSKNLHYAQLAYLFSSCSFVLQSITKSLCARTRKSNRAVTHTPAPTVVGMMHSNGTSGVKDGIRFSSLISKRALKGENKIKG